MKNTGRSLESAATGCECVCREAEGRAGGQMAFTALGRKLSLRWGFLCNYAVTSMAAMNSPGRVGSAAIRLAFLCKKLWANGGGGRPARFSFLRKKRLCGGSSDEERWVLCPPGPPVVDYDLLGLAGVKQQVVQQTGRGAPLIVWYKTHHVCVVRKLQSRVWGVHRCTQCFQKVPSLLWPNIIFNIKGRLCYVLFLYTVQ